MPELAPGRGTGQAIEAVSPPNVGGQMNVPFSLLNVSLWHVPTQHDNTEHSKVNNKLFKIILLKLWSVLMSLIPNSCGCYGQTGNHFQFILNVGIF